MVTLPERSLSTSAVMLLSMNHSNSGAGAPKALQVSVTVSPPDTVTSVASVGNVMVGGATHGKILKECICNEPCMNLWQHYDIGICVNDCSYKSPPSLLKAQQVMVKAN